MTTNSSFYQISNATVFPTPSNISAIADALATLGYTLHATDFVGADDTTKIANAISSAIPRTPLYLSRDYIVTSYSNPKNIPFTGPGRILDGTGRQYNVYTDQIKPLMSGREYLTKIPLRMIQTPGVPITMTILGDSRAAKFLTTNGRNDLTATITGTSMVVTAVGSNVFLTKGAGIAAVTGGALVAGTTVVSGPSTGGVGTYILSTSNAIGTSQTYRSSYGGGFAGWTEDQRVLGQPGDFFQTAFRNKGVQNLINIRPRAIGGTGIAYGDPTADLNDLAGGLDAIIIDYIYNDAINGVDRALADTETLLASIRSNYVGGAGNLDIIVIGPHAGFDPATRKMNQWNEDLEAALWALCKKYKCVYFRTYNLINDVEWLNGVGNYYFMDHPTSSTLVHPGMAYQSLRYGRLVDELFSGTDMQLIKDNTHVPMGSYGSWVPTNVYGQGTAYAHWVGGQRVQLEGAMAGGAVGASVGFAQLPSGMEPASTKVRNVMTYDGAGGFKPCTVIIQTNGTIIFAANDANTTCVNFAGVTYDRFD